MVQFHLITMYSQVSSFIHVLLKFICSFDNRDLKDIGFDLENEENISMNVESYFNCARIYQILGSFYSN